MSPAHRAAALICTAIIAGCGVPRQEILEAQLHAQTAQQKIATTRSELDALQEQHTTVTAKLAETSRTLDLCIKDITELRNQSSRATSEAQGWRSDAARCREDLEALQAKMPDLIQGDADARARIATVQNDLTACRQALRTLEAAHESQRLECTTYKEHQDRQDLRRARALMMLDQMRLLLDTDEAQATLSMGIRALEPYVRIPAAALFAPSSTNLTADGKAWVDRVATATADWKGIVSVEGHTDATAPGAALRDRFPTNWELSAARAANVARHLQTAHGVAPDRLRVVGYAASRPVRNEDTPEARQENRRIEVVLVHPVAPEPSPSPAPQAAPSASPPAPDAAGSATDTPTPQAPPR